jgi:predicted PurR-regulated permease PerM
MGDTGRWGLRIGAVIGGALALLLVYALRGLLFMILVAFIPAYVLDPAVTRLTRLLGGRGRAIAGLAMMLLLLLGVLVAALGPRVTAEFRWAAGQVLGVWGILFAVPAAAVLRVLIPELWALVQQKQVQA